MSNEGDYFAYLRRRSRVGLWYRNHWLYPRLCRYLRGRVLDVGCGIGDMLRYRPGTIGVDVNPAAVSWCSEQGFDARIMEKDRLPFGDAEFECAVLDNVLEHLEAPRALLAEIRRVIRPGGRLVVGVPGRKGYMRDPDHKIFYGERDVVGLLGFAGMSCEGTFAMPWRSSWFDANLPQYSIYGVFRRD
jgi:SAM-dependent methyltransferase